MPLMARFERKRHQDFGRIVGRRRTTAAPARCSDRRFGISTIRSDSSIRLARTAAADTQDEEWNFPEKTRNHVTRKRFPRVDGC